MKAVRMRRGEPADVAFLREMLVAAFFWDREPDSAAATSLRENAEFIALLDGWGRTGDYAVIAEDDGARVGAAWYRLWTVDHHSYGFVDATTPEIAIAVAAAYRGRGIGRALLNELIESARRDGFDAVSLSVSPSNPARRLYESLGFRKAGESGTSWTLRLPLHPR